MALACGLIYAGASMLGEIAYARGMAAIGEPPRAMREFGRAASLFPLNPDFRRAPAEALFVVGPALGAPEAVAIMRQALAGDPFAPDLIIGAAVILAAAGDADGAARLLHERAPRVPGARRLHEMAPR